MNIKLPDKTGKKQVKDTRFKPGKSGNPQGRPKGSTSINDILRKIGMEEVKTPDGKITKQKAVMRKVYEFALDGIPWAVHFVSDHTEGKPAQTNIITAVEPDKLIIIE